MWDVSLEIEGIMSPFNKGEGEKQDTLDPIWLHGWMPSVHQSECRIFVTVCITPKHTRAVSASKTIYYVKRFI